LNRKKNKLLEFFIFQKKFFFLLLFLLDLTAVGDDDGLGDHTGRGADRLDVNRKNVESAQALAKDDVLAVKPRARDETRKDLAAVCVATGVGHRQDAGADVLARLAGEGLVGELHTIDGLAAGAVAALEVAELAHELGDDAVEDGALVVEGLAAAAHALLAGAERAEVLGGLGAGVLEELEGDALGGLLADGDVEEDDGVRLGDGEGGLVEAGFGETEHLRFEKGNYHALFLKKKK
jgi:hypothetical protein